LRTKVAEPAHAVGDVVIDYHAARPPPAGVLG
jgi:hypothetical protein